MKCVLTIGGSDSSNGAGIQVDLLTFNRHEVFGYSVIATVTAQNSKGINAVHRVSSEIVTEQMNSVLADSKIQAVKTGMLGTRKNVEAVAEVLENQKIDNLVVDPVFETLSGIPLLSPSAFSLLKIRLFPLAVVVTPNLYEAGRLAGNLVETIDEMKEAAEVIHLFGPRWVLVKGGHLRGKEAVDVLYDGKRHYEYKTAKLGLRNIRGTGCIFSASLTAHLANGSRVPEAVQLARKFTLKTVAQSKQIGKGLKQVSSF